MQRVGLFYREYFLLHLHFSIAWCEAGRAVRQFLCRACPPIDADATPADPTLLCLGGRRWIESCDVNLPAEQFVQVGIDMYVPTERCQELGFHQIHLHVREAGEAAFRNDTEIRPASVVHAVIVVDLMREHQGS